MMPQAPSNNRRKLFIVIGVIFIGILGVLAVFTSFNRSASPDGVTRSHDGVSVNIPEEYKPSYDQTSYKYVAENKEFVALTNLGGASDTNSLETIRENSTKTLDGEALAGVSAEDVTINEIDGVAVRGSKDIDGNDVVNYYFKQDNTIFQLEFSLRKNGNLSRQYESIADTFRKSE